MDRETQRMQLCVLRASYPHGIEMKNFQQALYPGRCDFFYSYQYHSVFLACLSYLQEHGLIESKFFEEPPYEDQPGSCRTLYKITAKGLDFLEDDGGLSAILNTVTVKFDVDNVRELVETGLLTANVPEEKQGALMKAIREAPGTMLQTAVTKMVEKGMSDPVGTAKAVAGLFGVTW